MSGDAPSELASLEGRTVGVLSGLLAGDYFGALISAVARASSRAGGRTVAVQSQNASWMDPYRSNPGELSPVGWDTIDGFVVILNSASRRYLDQLRAAGKPVVMISHEEPGFACPVVLPDNRSGVREALEHLLGHGHRQIAFAGDPTQHDIEERYESYRATLSAHGIEPDPALLFNTGNNEEPGGREAAEQMIEAGLPCTAVVAATDYNARGLIAALKESGYSIPRDQAVVGFDDMPRAALTSPALSTVTQNFEQVGATAVELLARQMCGDEVEARHYPVKTIFIPRESCGCTAFLFPASLRQPDRGPVEEFIDGLDETFKPLAPTAGAGAEPFGPKPAEGATPPASRFAALGREVASTFETAAERELSSIELLQLSQVCEEFYNLEPSPRVFGVTVLAHRLARALQRRAARPDADRAAPRLDQCLQQLSVGISRAGMVDQIRLSTVFHDAVRNEYDISMELLRGHEKDPRSLEWMSRTTTRLGVLALWTPGATGPELEVVGSYDVRGGKPRLSQHRFSPESFPPAEIVARAGEEPEESLVMIVPVRTAAVDWGFLALVAPLETTLLDQESYFHLSALLSQALDYDAVTNSLRQRNEDLAFSYEREREMAEAVRQSEERYALAAKAANDGLWDWDLSTGTIYYSSRWKEMLGYSEESVSNNPEEWFSRVHSEDRPSLMSTLAERRRGGSGPFENEHRIRAANGDYRWVLCRGLGIPDDGRLAARLVGSLTDITERRSLEEQLLHQALYDSLTALPNRTLFLDRLSQSIAYARRSHGYEYAVLWLDLDGFKVVNDSLGHLFGDQLLVRVAERLSGHLREADTAARFGGDEFAVLLHHVPDSTTVRTIVTRLQDDLSRPYNLDGHEVVVTASIGIATSANGYEKADDVLRDADIAMYRAKSLGRSGFATFDSSMYAGAISRLQTETELRQAIDQSQFELHYQPIVDLADGTIQGMEALVRWRHPSRGLVPPNDFLPVAEESGLIIALGHWVETEACRQLAKWKEANLVKPFLRVSINLSNREFWAPGLLCQVDQVLAATGAPAEWVTFEITEGVIMHSLDKALDVLGELHARGIQIHIDDFGTGYSSLEALHRLPIEALKIDRSFIANLQDDKSTELVRTIVQLGRNFGVDVIAEGIETPAQRQILSELGCPLGQGYWFSRPVPATRLGEMLSCPGGLVVPTGAKAQPNSASNGASNGAPKGSSNGASNGVPVAVKQRRPSRPPRPTVVR